MIGECAAMPFTSYVAGCVRGDFSRIPAIIGGIAICGVEREEIALRSKRCVCVYVVCMCRPLPPPVFLFHLMRVCWSYHSRTHNVLCLTPKQCPS